jgi:hypothetical protein
MTMALLRQCAEKNIALFTCPSTLKIFSNISYTERYETPTKKTNLAKNNYSKNHKSIRTFKLF